MDHFQRSIEAVEALDSLRGAAWATGLVDPELAKLLDEVGVVADEVRAAAKERDLVACISALAKSHPMIRKLTDGVVRVRVAEAKRQNAWLS